MILDTTFIRWLVKSLKIVDGSFERADYFVLSSKWLVEYGYTILIAMVIALIVPRIMNIFQSFIKNCLKKRSSKKQILQRRYIESLTPIEYNLHDKLPQVLNYFFVGVILSPGIPLMLPLLCLIFTGVFWSSKLIMVKMSQKSSQIQIKIISIMSKILPIAPLFTSVSALVLFANFHYDIVPNSTDRAVNWNSVISS